MGNARYSLLTMSSGALIAIGLSYWLTHSFTWGVLGVMTAMLVDESARLFVNFTYFEHLTGKLILKQNDSLIATSINI